MKPEMNVMFVLEFRWLDKWEHFGDFEALGPAIEYRDVILQIFARESRIRKVITITEVIE